MPKSGKLLGLSFSREDSNSVEDPSKPQRFSWFCELLMIFLMFSLTKGPICGLCFIFLGFFLSKS